MESLTYMKNIKTTPKKMRLMLSNVKAMKPAEALDYLLYSPKKEAKMYHTAIKSAIHNAMITLKVGQDVLQFKLLTIEEGQSLRRYRPGSRGSAKPIKRKYSHIKIILVAEKEEQKKIASKTNEEVKNVKEVKAAKKTEKKPAKKVTTEKKEKIETKEVKDDKESK